MRLALLALVALGLSPGTWCRSPPTPPNNAQELSFIPLAHAKGEIGPFTLTNAWELASPNSRFGGYSALLLLEDGRFIAGSDTGNVLIFTAPGRSGPAPVIGPFGARKDKDKHLSDLESLTMDPASGRIWAGFEGQNALQRMERDFTGVISVRPPEMRNWAGNSGPEALARLADGRFVVLAEGNSSWRDQTHRALLYPSDPAAGAEPLPFRFLAPDGFDPVDMKQLPDGRVLVLLRRLRISLSPGFESALLLLDPAAIAEGKLWTGDLLAELDGPFPPENYEGLVVEPLESGKLALWLIADDNTGQFQRSLLVRLEWTPPAIETGDPAGK
ncbi:MAG: esterase-like activity of phytase family protein [Sphingomonadaceae bacterium]|nr:esterase-like activity of phytase family protein [Sphingomonadaceae bacterium]